jgi:hypothetical protein
MKPVGRIRMDRQFRPASGAYDRQMQVLLAEGRAETENAATSRKTRFADMMAHKAEAARRLVDTQQAIVLAKWSEGPRQ